MDGHQVILETVALLSVWLSNIVDLLEPDVIVMGGGVPVMLQPYFTEIHRQVSDLCVNLLAELT